MENDQVSRGWNIAFRSSNDQFVDIMGLVHKMIITITVTILEPIDRSVQVFEDLTASSTIFFKDARWFLPTFGWKMVALKLPNYILFTIMDYIYSLLESIFKTRQIEIIMSIR